VRDVWPVRDVWQVRGKGVITGFIMCLCAAMMLTCKAGIPPQAQDSLPPLTDIGGQVENGRALFTSREGGHCILCHQVATIEAPFQGDLGPSLTQVSDRLTPAQIRLRIVDYDRIKPGTTMPSYYRTQNLNQVEARYTGQTVLSAQDIEDIIAYLTTLKSKDVPKHNG